MIWLVASWVWRLCLPGLGFVVGCMLRLGTFWDSGAYVLGVACYFVCWLCVGLFLGGIIVVRFWFIVWFVVDNCGFLFNCSWVYG